MDFLNSFFQNVKDKLTSPFFGTLSFILIIHHWEFWYTLFNFDKDCTRTEKIATLSLIGKREFSGWNLLCDIITALVIMLIGYLVIFGTRALSLFFDHKAMPWITGKVVSKEVVLMETHKAVVAERDEYSEKYEEQRQRVRNFSKNLDEQTSQIQEKDKLILSEGAKINSLNDQNSKFQTESNDIQSENNTLASVLRDKEILITNLENENKKIIAHNGRVEKGLFFFRSMFFNESNKSQWKNQDQFPSAVIHKVNQIKTTGKWNDFLNFYNTMEHGGSWTGEEAKVLFDLGLITDEIPADLTDIARIIGLYSHVFNR